MTSGADGSLSCKCGPCQAIRNFSPPTLPDLTQSGDFILDLSRSALSQATFGFGKEAMKKDNSISSEGPLDLSKRSRNVKPFSSSSSNVLPSPTIWPSKSDCPEKFEMKHRSAGQAVRKHRHLEMVKQGPLPLDQAVRRKSLHVDEFSDEEVAPLEGGQPSGNHVLKRTKFKVRGSSSFCRNCKGTARYYCANCSEQLKLCAPCFIKHNREVTGSDLPIRQITTVKKHASTGHLLKAKRELSVGEVRVKWRLVDHDFCAKCRAEKRVTITNLFCANCPDKPFLCEACFQQYEHIWLNLPTFS